MSKVIQGAGGGKSKAPKQRAPVEAPNTLQSASTGKVLDLLAYGPIKGVVGGAKGVYLDDTPIQNADGSFNFQGIEVNFRNGHPDQDVIEGFTEVSNAREINTAIKYGTPVTRAVTNVDATSVTVTLRVNGLMSRNSTTGDTSGHSVPFLILVEKEGMVVESRSVTISGKTTSPYEASYRVSLPHSGAANTTVTVSRGTPDSTTQNVTDAAVWSKLVENVDVKHNYPGCALVGIEVDARLFAESLPTRKYLTELSIIRIPSNYNPYTRKYTGLWDGTFKYDWTDNPAWCFYDLATHPIIGAGISEVNKFALYEIGKYCDELVDDGYGGMEPRFTCNTLFTNTADAIDALNTLASVFRGMAYWGSDTVEPVADMPGPIRRIIRPADVVEGAFEYSGTSLKERHSVAIVQWNDPEDNYDAKPEIVELPEAIIRLDGYKEVEITAVACTSRGQARRLGLWLLYSEHYETQSLSFEVTVKNADLRPGDFIEVADPDRAGARLSGLVTGIDSTTRTLSLDALPDGIQPGWQVSLEQDDKGITRVDITSVNTELNEVRVNILPPNTFVGAGFSLTDGVVQSQQFRVLSVSESTTGNYLVQCGAHNPGKYDFVEKGLKLPDLPTSMLPSGVLKSPKNLTAESYTRVVGGTLHMNAVVAWEAPDDPRAAEFILEGRSPEDLSFVTLYRGKGVSCDIDNVIPGNWAFRVRSYSEGFGASAWHEKTIFLSDGLQPIPPAELIFSAATFSVQIMPRAARYSISEYEFWKSTVPLDPEVIESNATYIGTSAGSLTDTNVTFDTVYYYYVRAVNAYGQSDFVPGQVRTKADVEDIMEAIVADTNNGPVGSWFKEEIEKISGDELGSVNSRLEEMKEALEIEIGQMEDVLAYNPTLPYEIGDVVRGGPNGRRLYQAVAEVPLDTPPPNEVYWMDVGEMFEDANNIVVQLAKNTQAIEELEGSITSVGSSIRHMLAGSRADGAKADALKGWYTQAEVTELTKVTANEFEATAQKLEILRATVEDDVAAAIMEESLVRATADEALAQQITTVQADVGEVGSAVEEVFEAVADLNGEASAMWGVKLQLRSNGQLEVAGIGLGISNEGGVTQSEFVVRADRFVVLNSEGGQDTSPFAVINGTVVINSALIGDATITMAKIGGDLFSTNYVAGVSGWRLQRNGNFEINSPVPGQGRTQISNKGVRVYDANNRIRVKLGDLR